MRATREELVEAEEVGDKIADAILDYFADAGNRRIVERLEAAGVRTEAERKQLLSGIARRVAVRDLGKFSRHSRDELKALIESHGGKNLAAVSAQTDYLVAGEKMGPAKLEESRKAGGEDPLGGGVRADDRRGGDDLNSRRGAGSGSGGPERRAGSGVAVLRERRTITDQTRRYMTNRHILSGVGAALVTPFTPEGRIDYPALERMVDYVIDGGVDYIVALGTTAETPTLYIQERAVIARYVIERAAGRVPIVLGVGGNPRRRCWTSCASSTCGAPRPS